MNVAVRYFGDHRALRGKVLRLRKKIRTIQSFSSSSFLGYVTEAEDDDENGTSGNDLEETLTQANSFVEWVMVPLLSRKYVHESRVIQLDQEFIDALAERIDPHRPAKRRDAASLQRNAGVGLLMSDSARVPCGCGNKVAPCASYCFEIKPKWGFLCTEETEWEVKRRIDRFTMHQQLKKAMDPKAEISEYCPLDLFHGGREGILKSLQRLERTPQNNLRLFVDGKLVFPAHPHLSLKKALGGAQSDVDPDELFAGIAEALSKEDVLHRLLRAQTIGPLNDIESVYPIYMDMVKRGEPVGDIHFGYNVKSAPTVPPVSAEDRAEIVKRFLISCTARDCSLMITFSSCRNPTRVPLGQCLAGKYNYEITVVDLDAKPIAKMHHYFEVDQEIAKNYTEFIERQGRSGSDVDDETKEELSSASSSMSCTTVKDTSIPNGTDPSESDHKKQ